MLKHLAVILCLLPTLACTKPASEAPRAIEPPEVAGMLANGFVVIVDARETSERGESIANSKPIPLSILESGAPDAERLAKGLPKDRVIAVYCSEESCAKKAAEKLAALGSDKTAYFTIGQWKSAGLPVTPGAGQKNGP